MPHAQIGDTIRVCAPYKKNGLHAAGLTVTVSVQRDGVEIVSGAATTETDGAYWYSLLTTAAGVHLFRFYCADATVDAQEMEADWEVGNAWVQHLNADLNASTLRIVSPFEALTATLTINAGDAYLSTLTPSTAILIPLGTGADLTGATVYFCCDQKGSDEPFSIPVTVTMPTGSRQVSLELTAAQSLILHKGTYDIRANWGASNAPVSQLHGPLVINPTKKNPLV